MYWLPTVVRLCNACALPDMRKGRAGRKEEGEGLGVERRRRWTGWCWMAERSGCCFLTWVSNHTCINAHPQYLRQYHQQYPSQRRPQHCPSQQHPSQHRLQHRPSQHRPFAAPPAAPPFAAPPLCSTARSTALRSTARSTAHLRSTAPLQHRPSQNRPSQHRPFAALRAAPPFAAPRAAPPFAAPPFVAPPTFAPPSPSPGYTWPARAQHRPPSHHLPPHLVVLGQLARTLAHAGGVNVRHPDRPYIPAALVVGLLEVGQLAFALVREHASPVARRLAAALRAARAAHRVKE
eukprot:100121-Chlamydomonas_euryale.AAC.2